MARRFGILLILSAFSVVAAPRQTPAGSTSQAPPPPAGNSNAAPPAATLPDEGNIPEEDENEHRETEYHFNPIRARKEYDAGVFYFKKGSYRGAAARFLEATRWNPGWTEAFLKLGEAEAKLNHKEEARKALREVVRIDPQSKEAREAKKLSAKL